MTQTVNTDIYEVAIKERLNGYDVTFTERRHTATEHKITHRFPTLSEAIAYIKYINDPVERN